MLSYDLKSDVGILFEISPHHRFWRAEK